IGPDTGVTSGQITTGNGDDQIHIQGIRQPFSVNSGVGNDSFNVNSATQPQVTFPNDIYAQSLVAGDFNGDGNPDLVETNIDNYGTLNAVVLLSVRLGNADGTFAPAMTYRPISVIRLVAVADFNRDGKLDLAGSNFGNTVGI